MPTLVQAEADERDALLSFLDAQRGALRRALHGLSDEQAAAAPTASSLSLAGLVKHAMEVERTWIVGMLCGRTHDTVRRERSTWQDSFRLVEGETVTGVLEAYAAAAEETEEIIRGLPDLEVTAPLPDRPWFPPGSKRSARWILLHMIEETARHAGHADIIRETIDGRTAFELVTETQGTQGS